MTIPFITRSEYADLVQSGVLPGEFAWFATDTEQLFQHNVQRHPRRMQPFLDQTVTYTINSQGFRTEEFHTIDWAESVVVFGCSTVFGDAVTDSDTLSSQLSQLIDRPVINMGVSGAGMDLMSKNNLVLWRHCPRPWRVVNVWTGWDRITEYTELGANCYGSWTQGVNSWQDTTIFQRLRGQRASGYATVSRAQQWADVYATVNQDPWHQRVELLFHSQTVQAVWGDRSRQFTWQVDTQQALGCELLAWNFGLTARDLIHPDSATLGQWAEQIARSL